jgi:hypothetical protein
VRVWGLGFRVAVPKVCRPTGEILGVMLCFWSFCIPRSRPDDGDLALKKEEEEEEDTFSLVEEHKRCICRLISWNLHVVFCM